MHPESKGSLLVCFDIETLSVATSRIPYQLKNHFFCSNGQWDWAGAFKVIASFHFRKHPRKILSQSL